MLTRVAGRARVAAAALVACCGWQAATCATLAPMLQRLYGCRPTEGDDAAGPMLVHAESTVTGDCGFLLTDPPHGHRFTASARVRLLRGDRTRVALLVTQFRRGDVLVHQFATGAAESGREDRLDVSAYVMPGTEWIVVGFQAIGADGDVGVDDLSIVTSPEPVVPGAMATGPRAYLDHALALIARHAVGFDAPGHWSLLPQARIVASGAMTTADTYPAIRQVLERVDPSGHSRLIAPADVETFFAYPTRAPFGIEVASLDDGVGYLRIPTWTSLDDGDRRRFTRELRRRLVRTVGERSPPALVLDLRADGGGAFQAMLDGLCPLFEPRRTLGEYRDRAGRREAWRCRAASSDARARRLRTMPVAVLVGPGSASAGEMLAIALGSRAKTVLIGARTAGLTTGVDFGIMGDGALLAIATGRSVERGGRIVERFVDPEVAVPDAVAASADRDDPGIRAALGWIAAHR